MDRLAAEMERMRDVVLQAQQRQQQQAGGTQAGHTRAPRNTPNRPRTASEEARYEERVRHELERREVVAQETEAADADQAIQDEVLREIRRARRRRIHDTANTVRRREDTAEDEAEIDEILSRHTDLSYEGQMALQETIMTGEMVDGQGPRRVNGWGFRTRETERQPEEPQQEDQQQREREQ